MTDTETTQHQKVYDILSDGAWHCQREFWRNFIMFPHKRREDAEKFFKIKIEFRKCQHGTKQSRDYRLVPEVPTLF